MTPHKKQFDYPFLGDEKKIQGCMLNDGICVQKKGEGKDKLEKFNSHITMPFTIALQRLCRIGKT